ncbi:hypothetical protein COL5a_002682 [Colletotrichum fioriniae]|nr:hypothetical protein COL5a_002682 [Colletotrichum fioriniae]
MLAAGGTAGALLAAPLSDFLGRKKAVTSMAALFLIGCSMQEVPNLNVLYAGRLLAGVAIGATSMLAPQYLAENSPKSIRGSLTTSYNLMIILALAIAFWVNYAVSLWPNQDPDNNKAWQLALGIQLIPGFFLFALIWFVVETPRALISKGKQERGLKNLCKLRGLPAEHPYVHQEYLEILAQSEAEQSQAKGLFLRFSDVQPGSGTTPGGIVGIIMIYLYAFGWSFGHSVAPYVVAAEIFPSRVRSVCMSCCLFTNWIVNYGITSATPHMLSTMKYGTFLFFSIMTYIGVIFVFFCLPELKGRSIESMDDLFAHSLWTMFKRAYPTEDEKVRHDVQEQLQHEEDKVVSHVTMVEDSGRRA